MLSANINERLTRYDWPGNLYELESVLMRAVRETPATEGELWLQDPSWLQEAGTSGFAGENYNLQAAEKAMILRVMNDFSAMKYSKKEAALALGISVASLYRKIKEYNIEESSLFDG